MYLCSHECCVAVTQNFQAKIGKQKVKVTTSVKGIVVKEDKAGKPKVLFGPFACGDVKHTVAGGKKKNVLEVRCPETALCLVPAVLTTRSGRRSLCSARS